MNKSRLKPILLKLKAAAVSGRDGSFGSLEEAITSLDAILNTCPASIDKAAISLLVAPTGNLQDLSIDCGWSEEFLDLANQLESALQEEAS